jgi:hypothetical protein
MGYTHVLVSELESEESHRRHQNIATQLSQSEPFYGFVQAVLAAIPGTTISFWGSNSGYIYRPGDTHAFGRVGYADLRVKPRRTSASVEHYYVESNSIYNGKYRADLWQHKVIGSASMKHAVKAAQVHLVPYTAEQSAEASRPTAQEAVTQNIGKARANFRRAMEELTGASYFSAQLDNAFWRALRITTFASPQLNNLKDALFSRSDELDTVKNADDMAFLYVGFRTIGELRVVDTFVSHKNPQIKTGSEALCRCQPFEALPEWVQGSVSVLSMVEPKHYVHGVGVRVDDRIFFLMERGSE